MRPSGPLRVRHESTKCAQAEAIGGFYRLNRDLSLERLPLRATARFRTASRSARTARRCTTAIRRRVKSAPATTAHGVRQRSRVRRAHGRDRRARRLDRRSRWRPVERAVGRRARRALRRPTAAKPTRVDVPTAQPSCVAFGGAQLGTLYVTSARIGLDAAALAGDAHAGGVFVATPGGAVCRSRCSRARLLAQNDALAVEAATASAVAVIEVNRSDVAHPRSAVNRQHAVRTQRRPFKKSPNSIRQP